MAAKPNFVPMTAADNELLSRLKLLRGALVGYWAAWAEEKGRPDAASGSTMCRFTAVFLVRVLGWPWRIEGGEPFAPGDASGFFDGTGWQAHYWVADGKRIVDLTAHQFGASPIVITTVGDPRYSENYSEEELEAAVHHVTVRARHWAADFQRRHTTFPE
jgi:hypothetical protein